mmetsp:Transcript_5648/g.23181  ORF Transcript_5648/g.23181 Transcript_5648/m.23181 type:complete len:261 (-) Transcript_5648:465-1247(-)
MRHHQRLAHFPNLSVRNSGIFLANRALHKRGAVQELKVTGPHLHPPALWVGLLQKRQVVAPLWRAVPPVLTPNHQQRGSTVLGVSHLGHRRRKALAQRSVHGVVNRVQQTRRADTFVPARLEHGYLPAPGVTQQVHPSLGRCGDDVVVRFVCGVHRAPVPHQRREEHIRPRPPDQVVHHLGAHHVVQGVTTRHSHAVPLVVPQHHVPPRAQASAVARRRLRVHQEPRREHRERVRASAHLRQGAPRGPGDGSERRTVLAQ